MEPFVKRDFDMCNILCLIAVLAMPESHIILNTRCDNLSHSKRYIINISLFSSIHTVC